MAFKVDPDFLPELQQYGAFDIKACFNCGNCTAICPLSDEKVSFPRGMIRSAHLGNKDRLLGRVDLWQCYYCGECSDTCPRDANPSELVMASRRYAIANYDISGLARLFYTRPWTSWLAVSLLFFIGLITMNEQFREDGLFLPAELSEFIHNLGLVLMVVLALLGAISLTRAYRDISSQTPVKRNENESLVAFLKRVAVSLIRVTKDEVLQHRSFIECVDEQVPVYRRRWFIHAAMVWGFVIMTTATIAAMLFPTHGKAVPLWHFSRLMGTLGGLVFLYGVTYAIMNRKNKRYVSSKNSHSSDWFFLFLLLMAVFTGFIVEILIYMQPGSRPDWYYWVLFSHVTLSMELLLFLPFTKFAHAIYRTFALWVHGIEHEGTTGTACITEG